MERGTELGRGGGGRLHLETEPALRLGGAERGDTELGQLGPAGPPRPIGRRQRVCAGRLQDAGDGGAELADVVARGRAAQCSLRSGKS